MAKGPLDAEHFVGFINLRNKDTGHKMASMFEKQESSNPESEVSHEDVEDWIHADKETIESRSIADVALIDAVMNPDPESKTLDNESDEKNVTENIPWTKATNAYSTLQKFAEGRPLYSAQEVTQLHVIFVYKLSI
jgi:hypothetical protein